MSRLKLLTVALLAVFTLGLASSEKCCICGKKAQRYSDCKQFLSSSRYEEYFMQAFGVDPRLPCRHGVICRRCVKEINRWKKTTEPLKLTKV